MQTKHSKAAFSVVFSNVERCRQEVADDVVSDVAVDYVGMGVRVKFGDSMLNSGRIIQLFVGRTRFTQFCAGFNCIL